MNIEFAAEHAVLKVPGSHKAKMKAIHHFFLGGVTLCAKAFVVPNLVEFGPV